MDPQRMLREDPREEVMLMRIRSLEMRVASNMQFQKAADKRHIALVRLLNVLRVAGYVMAFMMVFLTYSGEYRDIPGPLVMKFTVSSKRFISGVAFMVGALFAHGVIVHWRPSAELVRLHKMHMLCKKLSSTLTDFRLESEETRLEKFDVPLEDMSKYFGLEPEGE